MQPFKEKLIVKILEGVGLGCFFTAMLLLVACLIDYFFVTGFLIFLSITIISFVAAIFLSKECEWETQFVEYIEGLYHGKRDDKTREEFISRRKFIIHEITRLVVKDGMYTITTTYKVRYIKTIHATCYNDLKILENLEKWTNQELNEYEQKIHQ